MSRDVPYYKDLICDGCGGVGAWDFMGDYLCSKCFARYNPPEEESEEEDYEEDKWYENGMRGV